MTKRCIVAFIILCMILSCAACVSIPQEPEDKAALYLEAVEQCHSILASDSVEKDDQRVVNATALLIRLGLWEDQDTNLQDIIIDKETLEYLLLSKDINELFDSYYTLFQFWKKYSRRSHERWRDDYCTCERLSHLLDLILEYPGLEQYAYQNARLDLSRGDFANFSFSESV